VPRTITKSTEVTVGGAFQYDCRDPELNGESNDKNGAESFAVSTYTT
jgi:hypothetical protein